MARSADRRPTTHDRSAADDDPLWYKDAIIYQAHVRAFFDSNNDGIGDFQGLTQKLDYLQGLGITCLWLLPFFPSPLRDDGYDIADYRNVHPSYGTLDDFKAFVRAAHERHIKVLIELVVNHTSDQHPWFQRARHAPPGSPEREFYVWSDTDKKFPETRIIFSDTEKSNWTFDPVAGAVLLASLLLASARPEPQQPGGRGRGHRRDEVLARSRRRRAAARRGAVPVRARRHDQREPAGDARRAEADAARARRRLHGTACCSPRRTSGPPTSARTSATATSATWRFTSR